MITTYSSTVPEIDQLVIVNGSTRSDIIALSVSKSHSGGGSTASLSKPNAVWDEKISDLKGSFIIIKARLEGNQYSTLFGGYITSVNCDSANNSIIIDAQSALSLADNCLIGENNNFKAEYPERAFNPTTRQFENTKWNVRRILEDFFSSDAATWEGGGGGIGTDWQRKIQLGNLEVLNNVWNDIRVGNLSFTQQSLRAAIDTLVNAVGYIRYYEKFTDNGTSKLNFYEIKSYNNPSKTVKISAYSNNALCADGSGTNLQQISFSENIAETKNRIIAVGQKKQYMIVLTVANGGLIKGWTDEDEAVITDYIYKSYKEKGSYDWNQDENYSNVFRKYYLNPSFKNVEIADKTFIELYNAAKGEYTGEFLPNQVYMKYYDDAYLYDKETMIISTSVSSTFNAIVDGVDFQFDNNYIKLNSPAIVLLTQTYNPETDYTASVYSETEIALAICINGPALLYDTGIKTNNVSLDQLTDTGFSELVGPVDFKYQQFTNEDYPIGGVVYPALVSYDNVTFYDFSSKYVYKDDSPYLQQYAEIMSLEKSDYVTNYNFRVPWFTTAYDIGDYVDIDGQRNYKRTPNIIESITWELVDNHSTSFSTSSADPQVAQSILEQFDKGDLGKGVWKKGE